MARQTLGELLGKQKESESQAAASLYVPLPQDTGLGVPFLPQEDVVPRVILGVYARELMTENQLHTSKYVIPHPPGLETGILSTEGNDVYTVPERFGDNAENDPIERFKSTSHGFFSKEAIQETFTKNSLSDLDKTSGHDLLAKEGFDSNSPKPPKVRAGVKDDPHYAAPDASTRPIAKVLYDKLIEANKYNPSNQSPFLDYGEAGERAFTKGMYSIQRELGKFEKDSTTYSIQDLRKIAGEILFKAQSMSKGDAETLMNNFAQDGGYGFTTDLMVLIPHATQIGLGTIGVEPLRARVKKGTEIFGTGQDDLIVVQSFHTTLGLGQKDPDVASSLTTSMNATSYGTMNSPVEPFDGVFPAGMAMPVLYAIIAIGLFGNIMLPLIAPDPSDLIFLRNADSPSTMALGRHHAVEDTFTAKLLELLGMPRSNGGNIFADMMAGLMLFFGLKEPLGLFPTIGPDFLESALNLIYSPGYFLVMTKGIMRDIGTIVNTIANFPTGNGVFAIISAVFSSLEVILKSYTFKFFIVMAKVGAQAIKGILKPGLDGHGGNAITYDEQKELTQMSPIDRTRLSRFHKNPGEIKSPLSLTLHYGAFLPSDHNYLIPGIKPLSKDDKDLQTIPGTYRPYAQKDAVNRLSPDFVDAIEREIDSEYVPFSIQDLRTNEIFSLPAFIASISDDFSISHGNTHGYGRTDPVFSYSKTTRSINLTFQLVAMNKDDHSYMYHIVNKLVSMCYPQRDRGLLRKSGSGDAAQVFSQPFSQSPTASPVVRIRLGDLIKSNRSRLALEKLFGGPEVLLQKGDLAVDKAEEKIEEVSRILTDYRAKLADARFKKIEAWNNGEPLKGPVYIPAGTEVYVSDDDGAWYTFQTQTGYITELDGVSQKDGAPALKTVQRGDVERVIKAHVIKLPNAANSKESSALGGKALAVAEYKSKNSGGILSSLFGDALEMKGYILPTACTPTWFDEDLGVDTPSELSSFKTIEDVQSFMDEATNPFAKSFMKGTPGKGLACVITQLSLGYDGSLWGTGESGKQDALVAPMKIQVQLGLSPIHEAPLGLTAQGDLFAPSHPVGGYSEEKGPSSSIIGNKGVNGKTPKVRAEEEWNAAVAKAKPYSDNELKDPTRPALFS